MSTLELRIGGVLAWRANHWMPCLWPLLFEPASVTEARRLHTTAFEGAERFAEHRAALPAGSYFAGLMAPFAEIEPSTFPRAMDQRPDAIVALDLAAFEASRPWRLEDRHAAWQRVLEAASLGDTPEALRAWERANLSPLRLFAEPQQDARSLASTAADLGLPPHLRAEALTRALFGQPVSRPAIAMHQRWTAAAHSLAAVSRKGTRPWWRRLTD